MTALPNTIALAGIADGSLEVAVDHRNNYAAIQTAVNALISALSGGSAGQGLQALSASSVGYTGPLGGLYRKTTSKTVNNTVVETDLLNGEITIAAGVLGTTGMLRLSTHVDGLNNSGAPATWQLKVKLGATTLFDTGTLTVNSQGASRFGWRLDFELLNLGTANSNVARMKLLLPQAALAGVTVAAGTVVAQGTGEKWTLIEDSFASTVDTSTSKTLVVTVTHGTAAATIETKLYGAVVEVL